MSKISKAKDITIEDYLNYPKFIIPLFQREYVWGKEEIDDFWNDLIKEDSQFLGSFILKDENYDSDKKTGYLEIVDGQQRTISILLLLKSISRNLSVLANSRTTDDEKNAEKQAEEIDRILSERDRSDLTKVLNYKLELYSDDANLAFKEVLEGNIVTNKEYKGFSDVQNKYDELFEEYLSGYTNPENKISALVTLKNKILDIKVIEVLVPTDDDAYIIFEAVNDRGADLGAAELLKNYLFSKSKDKDFQNEIHNEWKSIKKTLLDINRGSLDMTGFLRYYWIGVHEHLSKKALYSGFKKKINSKDKSPEMTPQDALREIERFRESVEKIFVYGFDDWRQLFSDVSVDEKDEAKVKNRATEWFSYKKNICFFPKAIQFLPVYSAIIKNLDKINLTSKIFIELLLEVEKVNFIYSYLLQKPTNRIDKMFSGIGRDISKVFVGVRNDTTTQRTIQKGIKTLKDFLKENINRKEVDEAIKNLNYNLLSDKQMINFVLINLEYSVGGYSRLLITEDLTIEHIYPKSIEKKGVIADWPKLDFDYKKLGHGLGNLTLLPATGPHANGSAGELSFMLKKSNFLTPSIYTTNRYFDNKQKWGKLEIEERLQYIQNLVWERWGV